MVPHELLVEVFDVHNFLSNRFYTLFVVEVLLSLHLLESSLLITQFEDHQLVLLSLLLNLQI